MRASVKVYLDTNVIVYAGGLDEGTPERRRISRQLLRAVRRGLVEATVSPMTLFELDKFRDRAVRRRSLQWLATSRVPSLPESLTARVEELAARFRDRGAVPAREWEDAQHLAWAILGHVDVLVSWNRRDLVRLKTRRLVGIISEEFGLPRIEIEFPGEVLREIEGA